MNNQKLRKSTIAVGASAGIFVYVASYIATWLNIPEYSTEIASVLTGMTGIIAGLLKPTIDSNTN